MKVLAMDYGERYVGLAVTDDEGRMPMRHSTIDQRREKAVPHVVAIVEEEKVSAVVVGVPFRMQGGDSEQTRACRRFIERLRLALPAGVSVAEIDERLTSKEAVRLIRAEGGKPEEEHAEAARLMLADWLQGQGL
ncbi:MAG: Holliday junction resolvase RuvX [Candidatus Andersenbacteria bacterium]|nr:Holliday junction resolvase RuvX [Candidatus Andersenbacteria bacterium]